MALVIGDMPTASDPLLELLKGHLPYSLPILRRLQFARFIKGGIRPSAHVLFASHFTSDPGVKPSQFAAAYVDFSPRPETAIWIYSSAELPGNTFSQSDDELVLALLRRMRSIETAYADTRNPETRLPFAKVGSLAEPLRHRLLPYGVRLDKSEAAKANVDFELCGKWLFRVEELPPLKELPDGFVWDSPRREDYDIVRSRTVINRSTETLSTFPGTLLRMPDGAPAAWCFLGHEGALSSLHVEEPYRGRGLAKAIAGRLLRERLQEFGDDGWGCADVNLWNAQSQGLCKSLGGKMTWETSWSLLHLDSVGGPL